MPLASTEDYIWPLLLYRDISTNLYYLGDGPNATKATYSYGNGSDTFSSSYIFQLDNVTTPTVGLIGKHSWDSVDTDIGLGPKDSSASPFKQPQFGYPFDEWSGQISFVAIDPIDTAYYGVNGTGVFQLAGAYLTDTTRMYHYPFFISIPRYMLHN